MVSTWDFDSRNLSSILGKTLHGYRHMICNLMSMS